jgi:hypothetical protein
MISLDFVVALLCIFCVVSVLLVVERDFLSGFSSAIDSLSYKSSLSVCVSIGNLFFSHSDGYILLPEKCSGFFSSKKVFDGAFYRLVFSLSGKYFFKGRLHYG